MNLGYSYRITDVLGFSLCTRMHITNLFGKKSEAVKVDGDLKLNDKGDTNINMFMKDRTIGFFGIYGGITFFIGGKR